MCLIGSTLSLVEADAYKEAVSESLAEQQKRLKLEKVGRRRNPCLLPFHDIYLLDCCSTCWLFLLCFCKLPEYLLVHDLDICALWQAEAFAAAKAKAKEEAEQAQARAEAARLEVFYLL